MGKALKFRLAAALLILAPTALAAQTPRVAEQQPLRKVVIEAQAIEHFDSREPGRVKFGPLTFRGGLVLTSSDKEFGGISSLRVAADGARFLAASDRGAWLRGRIVYRDGRPVGLADTEMAPMLGADGRPLARRGWYDSEAMTEDGNIVYVGFERVHQIVRFDMSRDGLRARGVPVPVPPALKTLPSNRGLECLAVPPKGGPLAGTLIAISERGLDARGNIQGFLIGGAAPGTFSVKRTDDFDVSDCTIAPGGDLLVLERRFSWFRGVAMRIRRVPLAAVKPGALLDSPELIFADMGHQIDNMEAISVHRTADGTSVLTLISDDNFSALQRTLLLQFTMSPE